LEKTPLFKSSSGFVVNGLHKLNPFSDIRFKPFRLFLFSTAANIFWHKSSIIPTRSNILCFAARSVRPALPPVWS